MGSGGHSSLLGEQMEEALIRLLIMLIDHAGDTCLD